MRIFYLLYCPFLMEGRRAIVSSNTSQPYSNCEFGKLMKFGSAGKLSVPAQRNNPKIMEKLRDYSKQGHNGIRIYIFRLWNYYHIICESISVQGTRRVIFFCSIAEIRRLFICIELYEFVYFWNGIKILNSNMLNDDVALLFSHFFKYKHFACGLQCFCLCSAYPYTL